MIGLAEIEAARQRIREHIFLSPCAYSEFLSRQTGCALYLKLENLQMTGSFKDRGAFNKILQLDAQQRAAGVITASAGNHAQGVAHAAGYNRIPATIVMPETTPLSKIRGTKELGAEIVLHGKGYDEAYRKALELQQAHGYTFVHAFNDNQVIAGQGTIGLELLEQVPDMDMVVIPVGGGGLIAGIATAIKANRPEVDIIGVESARLPAMQRSVEAGEVQPLRSASSLADGIAVANVGQLTLPIVRNLVSRIVTVTEDEIANAVLTLLEREKTLAEGAGAVTFAALAGGHVADFKDKKVVILVSGGNIDMTLLSKILERGMESDGRIARLRVIVPDRPGSIAELAGILAQKHSNIIQISQNYAVSEVNLEETEVDLMIETRGMSHSEQIVQAITKHGFRVKF